MISQIFGFVTDIGSKTTTTVRETGKSWLFVLSVILESLKPPYEFKLLLKQMHAIGVQSISVVALVGGFTGAVLAVQGEYTLSQFGATAFTGSAIALSLIRELGPVLTALMVNGRAGSAMTAELGIMKISEQIDALRAMGISPIHHLMVPRLLAGTISVPLLTAIFIVVGIAGGYMVAVWSLGLSSGTFMSVMIQSVSSVDVYSGFIKAIVFGFCVSWISCYRGWTCGFGAVGVNKATTSSVVTSSVVILVVDYFLTSILTNVFMD
ncbi:MAG TPA: ABC transporter permease [Oligoflexia bacterium]|nr:ABC transporter permease [Oligoflexia bacterium]HMP49249.1 ABC transporter permease [Oligoflexia bacterium]